VYICVCRKGCGCAYVRVCVRESECACTRPCECHYVCPCAWNGSAGSEHLLHGPYQRYDACQEHIMQAANYSICPGEGPHRGPNNWQQPQGRPWLFRLEAAHHTPTAHCAPGPAALHTLHTLHIAHRDRQHRNTHASAAEHLHNQCLRVCVRVCVCTRTYVRAHTSAN